MLFVIQEAKVKCNLKKNTKIYVCVKMQFISNVTNKLINDNRFYPESVIFEK